MGIITVAGKNAHDLIMELHNADVTVVLARNKRTEVLGEYCDHEWSGEEQAAHDAFVAARRHRGAVMRSIIEYGKRNELIQKKDVPPVCAHCGHLFISNTAVVKCERGKLQGIIAYKKRFSWDKNIPCRFSTQNRKPKT